MSTALTIQLNGQPRTFADLPSPPQMYQLVEALNLKPDRIAVELNGEIVPRSAWHLTAISQADRLEIVHFVGGGSAASHPTTYAADLASLAPSIEPNNR